MRIYVASSWKNDDQPDVVEDLRNCGHDVYDFRNPGPENYGFQWKQTDPEWEHWDVSGYVAALRHPVAVNGFQLDWKAMTEADACVLVLPCGRSAHIEAGYFVGAGKPLLILMGGDLVPELMYKMADTIHENLRSVVLRLEELEESMPGIQGATMPDGQPSPA